MAGGEQKDGEGQVVVDQQNSLLRTEIRVTTDRQDKLASKKSSLMLHNPLTPLKP